MSKKINRLHEAVRKPKLRLHLDVNKTILVNDKVQGLNIETSCVQILFWSAWGYERKGRWHWNQQTPAIRTTDPDAVLYGDFVRQYV